MIGRIHKRNGIKIAMINDKRRISIVGVNLLFAFLLMGSVFIVLPQQYDLSETYRKYFTIIVGCMFVAFYSLVYYSEDLDSIFRIVCITGLLETVYALAQFFKILPSYNGYYSYTGSFENPAVFAMLLAICVPISVYFALRRKNTILWSIIASYFLVFICFSESRASLLGACTAVLILFLNDSKTRKVLLNKWLLILLLPIVLGLLFFLYRYKVDSANGRLLIWRVSLNMFLDKPLFGFGTNGFLAHYMEYQSYYFYCHPDSPFQQLADNVNNPFNEFVLVLVNYGLIGFCCLLFLLTFVIKRLLSNKGNQRIILLSIIDVLLVISFFSYPFSMPFIWVISGAILLFTFIPRIEHLKTLYRWSIVAICFTIVFISIPRFLNEFKWKNIQQESLAGNTEIMLEEYQNLYTEMCHNALFMYNYGAELHYSKHYEESLKILNECSVILNDYEVQMLLGDNCQQIGDTISAINHYSQASFMVPSKYLPHYCNMKLFIDMGDSIQAVKTAKKIVSMNNKVKQSRFVQQIIIEAQDLLGEI